MRRAASGSPPRGSRRRPPADEGGGGRTGGAAAAGAATAPPPHRRRARAQVLPHRRVPAADRQSRSERRQRQQDHAQSAGARRGRPGGQRGLRRRRPRQPPRRRVRRATGAYKRHWGAYGAPPDDAPLGAYDPAAPPAKQFRTVSCVQPRQGRHRLRLRSPEQSHPGVQEGRHVRQGRRSSSKTDDWRRLGLGHRVLERSAAAVPLRRRRPRQEGVHPAARHARGGRRASAPAGGSRDSSTASAASRSIRRATSTRARPTKEASSEVHPQRGFGACRRRGCSLMTTRVDRG